MRKFCFVLVMMIPSHKSLSGTQEMDGLNNPKLSSLTQLQQPINFQKIEPTFWQEVKRVQERLINKYKAKAQRKILKLERIKKICAQKESQQRNKEKCNKEDLKLSLRTLRGTQLSEKIESLKEQKWYLEIHLEHIQEVITNITALKHVLQDVFHLVKFDSSLLKIETETKNDGPFGKVQHLSFGLDPRYIDVMSSVGGGKTIDINWINLDSKFKWLINFFEGHQETEIPGQTDINSLSTIEEEDHTEDQIHDIDFVAGFYRKLSNKIVSIKEAAQKEQKQASCCVIS